MQFLHTPQEIQRVHQWINAITRGIQADYPFYATTLPCVANILFQQNEMGAIFLNPAAFGELVVICSPYQSRTRCCPILVRYSPANCECLPWVICRWSLLNRSRKGGQRSRISSAWKVFGVKNRRSSSREDWWCDWRTYERERRFQILWYNYHQWQGLPTRNLLSVWRNHGSLSQPCGSC